MTITRHNSREEEKERERKILHSKAEPSDCETRSEMARHASQSASVNLSNLLLSCLFSEFTAATSSILECRRSSGISSSLTCCSCLHLQDRLSRNPAKVWVSNSAVAGRQAKLLIARLFQSIHLNYPH